MATKIRLKRTGARGNPHYRLVVMDSRKPRGGRTIEELGYYCPTTHPSTVQIDVERAIYWLGVGAQPSDTVRSLLSKQGILKQLRGGEPPSESDLASPVTVDAVSQDRVDTEQASDVSDADES